MWSKVFHRGIGILSQNLLENIFGHNVFSKEFTNSSYVRSSEANAIFYDVGGNEEEMPNYVS